MENQPNCAVCSLPMNFIKAGVSRVSGKPYDAFWACPDKCKQPYRAKFAPKTNENTEKVNMSDKDPLMLIGEELGAVNKRLDALAEYLKSKLG